MTPQYRGERNSIKLKINYLYIPQYNNVTYNSFGFLNSISDFYSLSFPQGIYTETTFLNEFISLLNSNDIQTYTYSIDPLTQIVSISSTDPFQIQFYNVDAPYPNYLTNSINYIAQYFGVQPGTYPSTGSPNTIEFGIVDVTRAPYFLIQTNITQSQNNTYTSDNLSSINGNKQVLGPFPNNDNMGDISLTYNVGNSLPSMLSFTILDPNLNVIECYQKITIGFYLIEEVRGFLY
jgi:hypothetical protein